MKLISFFLILFFIATGCKDSKKSYNINNLNSTTVIVKMANADGKKVELSVEGDDFETRQTQTIEEGKTVFKVPYSHSDIAFVESKYNIENIKLMRNFIPLILEQDTIIVESKLTKDSIQVTKSKCRTYYNFENIKFLKGRRNRSLNENSEKLVDLSEGFVYDFSKLDSLNNTVFPSMRKNTIELYNDEFTGLDQRVQLELLYDILNGVKFKPKYLDSISKKALNDFYYGLTDFEDAASYRLKTVNNRLSNVNNYGNKKELAFKNFTLENNKNEKINLSTSIKNNKLTVFYLWFSGCGPCRNFNRKMEKDVIEKLKKNDVELISVNTDSNRNFWKKASKQDDIFWKNIYGGNIKEDIEFAYDINSYPTKIVFDNNFNIIDFKFSSPNELLELKDY